MAKPLKPATTFDDQVKKLESRGLIISDHEHAKAVLSRFNYYKFTGYLHNFRKPDSDDYVDGLTFDQVYGIIEFDRRFRNVLMYVIEAIEHTLKTKIAYELAHSFGPDGYLTPTNFRDPVQHRAILARFNEVVERNRKLPFVVHHRTQYGGIMPIWVAIELFTLGMLEALYGNLPRKCQYAIAKQFGTGPLQLASWVENVRYLRNMIAHYMRLYDFGLQKIPRPCRNHHARYSRVTHRAFDIVYVMKALFLDAQEWDQHIVPDLERLFDEYGSVIDLSCIGFPPNWKELLLQVHPQEEVAMAMEL
jgi:abortive infection bacteriophage resistance protein